MTLNVVDKILNINFTSTTYEVYIGNRKMLPYKLCRGLIRRTSFHVTYQSSYKVHLNMYGPEAPPRGQNCVVTLCKTKFPRTSYIGNHAILKHKAPRPRPCSASTWHTLATLQACQWWEQILHVRPSGSPCKIFQNNTKEKLSSIIYSKNIRNLKSKSYGLTKTRSLRTLVIPKEYVPPFSGRHLTDTTTTVIISVTTHIKYVTRTCQTNAQGHIYIYKKFRIS